MPYNAWISSALSNCSGGTDGRPSLAYSLAKFRLNSFSTSRTRPRILPSGCPGGTSDLGDRQENSGPWSRKMPRIRALLLHRGRESHLLDCVDEVFQQTARLIRTVSGRGLLIHRRNPAAAAKGQRAPKWCGGRARPRVGTAPTQSARASLGADRRNVEIRECLSLVTGHRLVTPSGARGLGKER